jgi:hypothetical protein
MPRTASSIVAVRSHSLSPDNKVCSSISLASSRAHPRREPSRRRRPSLHHRSVGGAKPAAELVWDFPVDSFTLLSA